eukprot:gnl/TRDRNA2_/TRDRNA2_116421_c2_seq1.p1 gnl/TRDRNA2_/TRDRNA2_116421_c2~~gnl/TRDRNA2_/TRDRNA2_116421_c2_seq1.p1  ORF type:complete len:174 (-),score=23.51 gnl/TRDRNA2_/TRDRNA2_116421_c2_seq1:38-526(-)
MAVAAPLHVPPAYHDTASRFAGASAWFPHSSTQPPMPNICEQPRFQALPIVPPMPTAAAVAPIHTTPNLISQLQIQLEYYFSNENLATDLYLRGQMTQEGYVPLLLLSGFRRIRQLAPVDDGGSCFVALLVQSINQSTLLETNELRTHVRRARDWEQWVWLQ